MTAENEEDYNSDVPVSWQMTIIMYPYFPPGDSRRSSMGLALWGLTKTQFIPKTPQIIDIVEMPPTADIVQIPATQDIVQSPPTQNGSQTPDTAHIEDILQMAA